MNKKLMVVMLVVAASALYVRFQVVGMEEGDSIYQAEERRRAARDAERAVQVPGAEASEISTGPSAEIVKNNYAQMWKYEISKKLSFPPKVMAFLYHKLCIRVQTLSHNDEVSSVAFSPDGRLLATGSWDKTAGIWDVATGQRLQTLQCDEFVYSVAFSPDGRLLATGSDGGIAGIWDVATGQRLQTLQCDEFVYSVAFSPDGRLLATGDTDGTAVIWNVKSGNKVRTLQCGNSVSSVAFSPDGKLLATGSYDLTAGIWDVASGNRVQTLQCGDGVLSVAFSPDGKLLATGSWDRTAGIWNVASGNRVQTLQCGRDVLSVAFSPDGKLLATGSKDERVVIWDLESGQKLKTLQHNSYVNSVAFSPDGKLLATANSYDASLWNVECFQTLERSIISTSAQYELMQAFEVTLKNEENGTVRIVGKINATPEQWATFETLPANIQTALRPLIRNEREQERAEDYLRSKQKAAAMSLGKEEE